MTRRSSQAPPHSAEDHHPHRHRFGGQWTSVKLQLLKKYLEFFTSALKKQPYRLVYIDAFAGTGRCVIRGEAEDIDGSAKIALDCAVPFTTLHFIERKRSHVRELRTLVATHPEGKRVSIHSGLAKDSLPSILATYNWRRTRGVLFLDPYGLQCSWSMIEQIAGTRALDVFFMVSLSGLFRQAAISADNIDASKAAALTRFLGTEGWRDALYIRKQGNLFGGETIERDEGYLTILAFVTARLESAFPHVGAPLLLKQSTGAPLFALYFAVSNPSSNAIGLSTRVIKDIFKQLEKREGHSILAR